MEIFFHWKVLLLTLHLMDNKGYGTQKEWFSYHISIWLISKMLLCRYIFQSPKRYILRFALLPWDQRIIPIYAFFCTFSTFAQRIFKGWGCKFTRSFGKVIGSKSIKTWFMHFFLFNNFSYCWNKFDYPGSIVYLSHTPSSVIWYASQYQSFM